MDIGVIENRAAPKIDVPASAFVGEPFTVSATTVGACTRLESTETTRYDHVALITPYDRSAPTCVTRELSLVQHEATLTFDAPGDKTLRFYSGDDMEYERTVRVELR